MNGLFGFDPKSLTDEELLERWHTLSRRIVWANRFGSMETVNQLLMIQNVIALEQRERIIEPRLRARAAMPDVLVETDPDLAAEQKAAVEAAQEKQSKKPIRPNVLTRERAAITRERVRPTPRPTIGDSEDKK